MDELYEAMRDAQDPAPERYEPDPELPYVDEMRQMEQDRHNEHVWNPRD